MNIIDRNNAQEMLEGNTINMDIKSDDGLENTTTYLIKEYISYLEKQNIKLETQVDILMRVIKGRS